MDNLLRLAAATKWYYLRSDGVLRVELKSISSQSPIHIRPNPVTDVLNLGYIGEYKQILISGMTGQFMDLTMSARVVEGTVIIDTSNAKLPSGMYYITVTLKDGSSRHGKFIQM